MNSTDAEYRSSAYQMHLDIADLLTNYESIMKTNGVCGHEDLEEFRGYLYCEHFDFVMLYTTMNDSMTPRTPIDNEKVIFFFSNHFITIFIQLHIYHYYHICTSTFYPFFHF